MSNLPIQAAVTHNDDNDEQTNSSQNNKLTTLNSRITSPLVIQRQQYNEAKRANNQACDEIHDLQSKPSSIKKTNTNDNSSLQTSKQPNSDELMQGNYYDRTRLHQNSSPSSSINNHPSESKPIDISVEDYKKKCTPTCTSENSTNKDRNNSPPFGDTSESIQENVVQRAGRLLEQNKTSSSHSNQNSMKNHHKSHEIAAINYFPNVDDTNQRSSSPSSSSECSTDDSSTSNKCLDDHNKTNIPYEKLLNDDDDDDHQHEQQTIEEPKKILNESSTLLNKNLSQTYGTQLTTNERGKYVSNNGYNSHGSSITTKSSSDNSGSIRTNSGSDNDEESDEEHYNNSTLTTNNSSIKSLNKSNDTLRYLYPNESNNYSFRQTNPNRTDDINDEKHLQVPRFKQLPPDDSNGNNNKLNSIIDQNNLYTSKRSFPNQTNISSSVSSQQNRSQSEQEQQPSSRNNSRPNQSRKPKKRKQSQQEIIRTELIPGHRGDRDVDELVMFIDGNSSNPISNSVPLRPTDTNKPRLSTKTTSVNEVNNDNENKTNQQEDNQPTTTTITHSTDDTNNQSVEEHQNITTEPSSNLIITATNDNVPEQPTKNTDVSSSSTATATATNLNSEVISEPFVTVTHRRRVIKERRQENTPTARTTRLPPPPLPSTTNINTNNNDKRRISSTSLNGNTRPIIPPNKSNNSPTTKEENSNSNPTSTVPSISLLSSPTTTTTTNPTDDQVLEKQQSSPRLSSHSSSSSLSSLLKRQSKGPPPPVVFLNKSNDIELNDVSFGFDLDATTPTTTTLNNNVQSSPHEINSKTSINEQDNNNIDSISNPLTEPLPTNEMSTQRNSTRKYPQQRSNRATQFYSGTDIRPQHHRNYPSQSSYVDPLLLLQYQRYQQQIAYMNYLRTQYLSSQSPYIYLPTAYPPPPPSVASVPPPPPPAPVTTVTTSENDIDDETNPTSSAEQIQEPLLVYATPTGQIYIPTKKTYNDSDPQATIAPIPTVYPTGTTIYPTNYFYPSQVQPMIPSHPAYFQPIASPSSLVIENKSLENDHDDADLDDNGDEYDNSTKYYPSQLRHQSSSDIMSNALQLVYSQQKRNAQTNRFNLDDLTAYLAMKWTDTVDHYMQGDSRILLVDDSS